VVPQGFSESLDDVMANIAGHWVGSLELGAATPVSLTYHQIGPAYASRTEAVASDPMSGAPNILCGPAYEIEVEGVITAGTALNETFRTTFRVVDGMSIEIPSTIDLADVHGDLRPGFDPSSYDTTTLALTFTSSPAPGETRLAVSWAGSTEDAASGSAQGELDPVDSTPLTRP